MTPAGGGSLTALAFQQPQEGHLDQILPMCRQCGRTVPLHCTDQHLADPLDAVPVWVLGARVAPPRGSHASDSEVSTGFRFG